MERGDVVGPGRRVVSSLGRVLIALRMLRLSAENPNRHEIALQWKIIKHGTGMVAWEAVHVP
jgi:hypothetical protein